MFTGLVEQTAAIKDIRVYTVSGKQSATVILQSTFPAEIGDSIAVNGACLTAVVSDQDSFAADVSVETLRATTLGDLAVGDPVNLESSLRMGDSLDGTGTWSRGTWTAWAGSPPSRRRRDPSCSPSRWTRRCRGTSPARVR